MRLHKMFTIAFASLFVLILMTYIMPVVTARPVITRSHNIRNAEYSTNWSGYAVTGSSVTFVSGNWVVPSIQGACSSTNQYSSFWVGIDGFNSNSVEQTGTDTDCQGGLPTYYAWYEFYPHPSYLINTVPIHPGDTIYASVTYGRNGNHGPNKFTLFLQDVTTGQSFSTTAKVRASMSSAEWIAEAPYSGGILPLADFGTAYFSNSFATMSAGSNYINGFAASSIHQIDMATSSGVLKDTTSSLSSNGGFSVTWLSSGP